MLPWRRYIAAEERRLGDWLPFVGAHTHTCGVRPGLNTAVGVELMARQVPSSARNEQVKSLKLFSYHSHVSSFYDLTAAVHSFIGL